MRLELISVRKGLIYVRFSHFFVRNEPNYVRKHLHALFHREEVPIGLLKMCHLLATELDFQT
ncbi:hypothetical protein ABEV54_02280 [Peribacillus psychrosaccharolyticus]|uniref:hypothetical protein n=1 Tax=Peribacillus psychrosaccharolyticus TaxID=1407 RepID=UPI003D29F52F